VRIIKFGCVCLDANLGVCVCLVVRAREICATAAAQMRDYL